METSGRPTGGVGADTDRNLLFAVLALQADLIDTQRFVQACTLWASRKDTPLAEAAEDMRRLKALPPALA